MYPSNLGMYASIWSIHPYTFGESQLGTLNLETVTQYSESVKKNGISTVNVSKVVELQKEPFKIFDPNHPLADGDGYIYKAPINVEEEMVDMMDASRQYQNNVDEVLRRGLRAPKLAKSYLLTLHTERRIRSPPQGGGVGCMQPGLTP